MRLSFIEDSGAEEIIKLLADRDAAKGLSEVDLSNNMISFKTCGKLQEASQNLGSKGHRAPIPNSHHSPLWPH